MFQYNRFLSKPTYFASCTEKLSSEQQVPGLYQTARATVSQKINDGESQTSKHKSGTGVGVQPRGSKDGEA